MTREPRLAEGIERVIWEVRQKRGIDLERYKPNFLKRRIDTRVRATGATSYLDYASILRRDTGEYRDLFDALSIKITEFLRDADVFDAFYREVIPRLLASEQTAIRLYSAGCSTGEEPYSVAILMKEAIGTLDTGKRFTVMASDFSGKAIEEARSARYPSTALKNMPRHLTTKYFSLQDSRYEVKDEVKSSVSFEIGDMLTLPFPRSIDVAFCRNVLIYFDRETQYKVLAKIHQSLRPSRFLIIGKTETIMGPSAGLFAPFMPQERIYIKR